MIRSATSADRAEILGVHRAAFGSEEEAKLVAALLDDPTAAPRVSMLAEDNGAVIAHVLFTRVMIPHGTSKPTAAILCPLAVHPDQQSRGVGTDVTKAGLEQLRQQSCDLVFVLGHPDYYPRFGFVPAGQQGLTAPYPIPEEHADAWMVLDLSDKGYIQCSGQISCATSLMEPRFWVE